ncbi:MAG: ABC transporter permease [Deltaproteobacteria bacterium]|nr:ABC transporter permease [Deltaproteobacteria bacterium]
MLLLKTMQVAFRAILANKMRTGLTMLGIVIGVAAIIAMISIGEGAKAQVVESITRFGTNSLRVRPGAARLGHIQTGAVETLTIEDADVIRASVADVAYASPAISGTYQVKYANKNSTTLITGTTPEYMTINNFPVDTGRLFDATDLKLVKRVAMLGTTVKKELFGDGPAIGSEIKVSGMSFLVIGVMQTKGQTSWYDPDDQVFIPITTSQKRLSNQDHINDVYIQVATVDAIPKVKAEVEKLLRARHRIAADAESDFSIRDFSEFVRTLKQTVRTFSILLSGIAAVSLLVGGIGVMNIMLVSVTERTREIGIRMAVGARRADILRQFLIEAVSITITGGAIGVGLGMLISKFISWFGEWQTIITPYSVLLGFFFAVAIGIIFGIYPARKASLLDPIEALRYE